MNAPKKVCFAVVPYKIAVIENSVEVMTAFSKMKQVLSLLYTSLQYIYEYIQKISKIKVSQALIRITKVLFNLKSNQKTES